MAINFMLPIRGVQFLFAIIVLGTSGHLVDIIPINISQLNFLLFCAIWSFLLLFYLIGAPLLIPSIAHPYVILGIDALTMLFWFAGFIAWSVWLGGHDQGCAGHCSEAEAAAVFGAFDWALFAVTTVLSGLALRGGSATA